MFKCFCLNSSNVTNDETEVQVTTVNDSQLNTPSPQKSVSSANSSEKDLTLFENLNIHEIPFFSLEGLNTWCRVIDIYDGDTITVVIPLMTSMYKFHIRLYGIDTPEIKSLVQQEKDKAIISRNRLIELCTNVATNLKSRKEVQQFLSENIYLIWINAYKMDKYGRVLANVYKSPEDTISFTKILIDEKLGYEYFGKTKLVERAN